MGNLASSQEQITTDMTNTVTINAINGTVACDIQNVICNNIQGVVTCYPQPPYNNSQIYADISRALQAQVAAAAAAAPAPPLPLPLPSQPNLNVPPRLVDKVAPKDTPEERLCQVCMVHLRCVVMQPCGQVTTCLECTRQLLKRAPPTCPACMQNIASAQGMFL